MLDRPTARGRGGSPPTRATRALRRADSYSHEHRFICPLLSSVAAVAPPPRRARERRPASGTSLEAIREEQARRGAGAPGRRGSRGGPAERWRRRGPRRCIAAREYKVAALAADADQSRCGLPRSLGASEAASAAVCGAERVPIRAACARGQAPSQPALSWRTRLVHLFTSELPWLQAAVSSRTELAHNRN
eukprot:scaffold3275_cov385-Prasinococcus_capsulatus_cf.AAC.11